ncbi:MAG: PQQ-binding-like beta-propeller repeat protein [Thermodesulfobacteriota bacterium]
MRKRRNNLSWFILAAFILACFPAAANAAQWGMHRHDAQHTNSTAYSGPTRISEKWSFQDEITNGGVAIADDGTIYFVDGYRSRNLYVLNPDGTVKQIYDLYANGYGGGCCTRPVIGPDGTIYVSANGIVAFNPDLTVKWHNPSYGSFCCGSMSLGPDGSLYLVEGELDVLDAQTGAWKWSSSLDRNEDWINWAPATSNDGSKVYITTQHNVYAVSSVDGAAIWDHAIDNPGSSSAVVAANGDVYVPDGNDILVITERPAPKQGITQRKISVGTSQETVFEIAMAADGSLASVTYNTVDLNIYDYADSATGGKLYMIDPNQDIVWSAPIEAEVIPNWTMTYVPLIDANNNVYLGTVDSANMAHVYGFDANGNSLFYRSFDSNCGGGPVTLAMDNEGILYFSIFMGYTYAYRQTDPWGNYHGNAQHTSSSIYHGPTQIAQKWAAGVGTEAGIAIALDGTIYAGGADGNLYAFNPDGSVKGVFDGSASGVSNAGLCCASPVIGPDGTIYIAGRYTWALNPDLTIKWVDTSMGLCCGSLTVGPDNTLYRVEWDYIDAIDGQTGTLKWNIDYSATNDLPGHSPAVSADGKTLYLATQYNLYALNSADGSTQWGHPIINPGWATALVAPDGRIYASNDSNIDILNSDGTLAQTILVGSNVFEISLGADGTIACVTFDSWTPDRASGPWAGVAWDASNATLYAIDPSGAIKWSTSILGFSQVVETTQFAPVIDASGNIYIFTRDEAGNYLYGFDAAGNQLFLHQMAATDPLYGPARITIGADGNLYVSWFGGDLYAFEQAPMP